MASMMENVTPQLWRAMTNTASYFDFSWNPPADYQEYNFEIQVLNGKEKFLRVSPPSLVHLRQIIEQTVIPKSQFRTALTKYRWSICFIVKDRLCKLQHDEQLKQLIDTTKPQWYSLRIKFETQQEYDGASSFIPIEVLYAVCCPSVFEASYKKYCSLSL